MAEFDRKDFKNIRDLSIATKAAQAEVKFEFAYKAMIKLSIALVAQQGYKVISPRGHHVRLIEKLSELLEDEDIMAIGDVMRAKIALLAAEGLQNKQIGERLDLPRQIVSKWRKRFFEERLAGLEERSRRGRPRTFSPSSGHGS